MSVAEAREAVWDGILSAGSIDALRYVGDAALDRLILEVRAEMPCSNYYVKELQRDDCTQMGGYCESDGWPPATAYNLCPSCTAREALKV